MLMLYLHISLRNIWRTESTKGAEFDTIFFLFLPGLRFGKGTRVSVHIFVCGEVQSAEPAGAPLVGPWMYGVTSPIVPNGCI